MARLNGELFQLGFCLSRRLDGIVPTIIEVALPEGQRLAERWVSIGIGSENFGIQSYGRLLHTWSAVLPVFPCPAQTAELGSLKRIVEFRAADAELQWHPLPADWEIATRAVRRKAIPHEIARELSNFLDERDKEHISGSLDYDPTWGGSRFLAI